MSCLEGPRTGAQGRAAGPIRVHPGEGDGLVVDTDRDAAPRPGGAVGRAARAPAWWSRPDGSDSGARRPRPAHVPARSTPHPPGVVAGGARAAALTPRPGAGLLRALAVLGPHAAAQERPVPSREGSGRPQLLAQALERLLSPVRRARVVAGSRRARARQQQQEQPQQQAQAGHGSRERRAGREWAAPREPRPRPAARAHPEAARRRRPPPGLASGRAQFWGPCGRRGGAVRTLKGHRRPPGDSLRQPRGASEADQEGRPFLPWRQLSPGPARSVSPGARAGSAGWREALGGGEPHRPGCSAAGSETAAAAGARGRERPERVEARGSRPELLGFWKLPVRPTSLKVVGRILCALSWLRLQLSSARDIEPLVRRHWQDLRAPFLWDPFSTACACHTLVRFQKSLMHFPKSPE